MEPQWRESELHEPGTDADADAGRGLRHRGSGDPSQFKGCCMCFTQDAPPVGVGVDRRREAILAGYGFGTGIILHVFSDLVFRDPVYH